MRSRSSCDEVRMITGMVFVRSSLLMRWRTSRPLTFGSLRSRMIRRGFRPSPEELSAKMYSSAWAPSVRIWTRLARLCFLRARRVNSTSLALSSTRRISPQSFGIFASWGQGEAERGPFVDDAVGPYSAAVSLHDPPDNRQSDARAFEGLARVEPLEDAEQLGLV